MIVDHFSRYVLCGQRFPDVKAEGVHRELGRRFRHHGLPDAMARASPRSSIAVRGNDSAFAPRRTVMSPIASCVTIFTDIIAHRASPPAVSLREAKRF